LIEEALKQNHDLRIAASRVEQARYAVGIVRADALPQVGYQASAERGKISLSGAGISRTQNVFFGALQTAWEVELWGRIRRSTEVSLANLYAAEDTRRGVVLSLVTTSRRPISSCASSTWSSRSRSARATRSSRPSISSSDSSSAESARGSRRRAPRPRSRAPPRSIPDLERQIVAKENQLSILLGRPPGDIPRGSVLTEQGFAPGDPVGLPADLLAAPARRAASREDAIVAANAQVGVAIADFFPAASARPRCTATRARSSTTSSISGSNVWSIAAALSGPLFQSGRLYYGYKFDKAAWEESLAVYQQTVLNALAEVSNTLVARQKIRRLDRRARASGGGAAGCR
jgi:multidrug efflux system outer membrane protein